MTVMPPDLSVTRTSAWSRRVAATIGALSALVALAVAELVALILPGQPSPVIGIANQVINLTPASLREALIARVGTADKMLLTIGIVIVIAAVGGLVGIKFRGQVRESWLVYLILGLVVGVVAGITTAQIWWSLLASLAGALAGWLTFASLLRTKTAAIATPDGSVEFRSTPALDRRTFLLASSATAVAAFAGVAVLSAIRNASRQTVEAARQLVLLPKPVKPAPPVPPGAAVNVAGNPPPVTSNADFYRIDTALTPPAIAVETWSLSIKGRVKRPLTLTYNDLMAMPQIEQLVTLACVSNPVGGDLVGNALWQGVPLQALLEKVGLGDGAEQIVAESVDGFTAAFPTQIALDGRAAMVAVGMNGVPLPIDHGFPARLVVPGLYGYVSATKWLSEIRLTTFAEESGFWIPRGWVADGTIESASRIDVPTQGAAVTAGNVVVAGRAWHQEVAIGAVEVSVDEGAWQEVTLASSMGIDTWRLWSWNWPATSGDHSLRVRMIDANGAVQSPIQRAPGPGASSGYQSIDVVVD